MQGHEMSGSQPKTPARSGSHAGHTAARPQESSPASTGKQAEHSGHAMPMPAPAKVESHGYRKEMVEHGPDHHAQVTR